MLFACPTGAGQRRVAGRERVHHPELQADLGEHPEDLGCSGSGEAPVVQVPGAPGGLAVGLPRPVATGGARRGSPQPPRIDARADRAEAKD